MHLRKTALLFFLFIFNYNLMAQNLIISGQITNVETGEPIPYVTVGVPRENLGTVANEKGEFKFTIPLEKASKGGKVIFSCIGFEAKEEIILNFGTDFKEIRLKPQPKDLKEVVINPEKPKRRILGKNERHRLISANFFTIYEEVDDELGKE